MENVSFNTTIQVKETTKFANEILEIPLQVVITVPPNYKPLKSTSDSTSAVIGIIVSLLITVFIVALAWKMKTNKQSKGSFIFIQKIYKILLKLIN